LERAQADVQAAQVHHDFLADVLFQHVCAPRRHLLPGPKAGPYSNTVSPTLARDGIGLQMTSPSLTAAERYFHEALARLHGVLDPQRGALDRAATLCTEAIATDGLVHLFGCGHSRMLCEEMTPRQGCFVGWHTIVELGLTFHNLIVGPNGLRQ